jgi:hypothetical protein
MSQYSYISPIRNPLRLPFTPNPPKADPNAPSFSSAVPSFVKQNKIARTNRFIANIYAPPRLSLYSLTGVEIESAEIPAITIQTTEFQYDQSPRINIPLIRSPQNQFNLTIRLDEKHKYRQVFSAWLEQIIQKPSTSSAFVGYSKKYYNEYTGSVQIMQLGIEGKVTAGVTLLNAYPISIEALRYDWGENDQYHRLNVQFTYFDYMEMPI